MQSTIDKDSINKAYAPLRELLKSYGTRYCDLTNEGLDEILEAASMVTENFAELWRVKCDVEGCDKTASSQGVYYREYGYICLCDAHTTFARSGNDLVRGLKPEAIQREANRKPDGTI